MINRIARPIYSIALAHAGGATTANTTGKVNGLLKEVIIKTPITVDSSATTTIDILDSDSNVIYTKSGLAANTTTKDLLTGDAQVPLSGTYTVRVTFSAAQTATDTTTNVVLLIDRG